MLTEEIIELYKSNKINTMIIGELTGINYRTVGRYLKKENIVYNYNNEEWLRSKFVDECLTPSEISKLANCNIATIHSRIKRFGLDKEVKLVKNRKYSYDVSYFKTIDTEEKAYWLGFIYADGHVSYSKGQNRIKIQLASIDLNHLEKFKTSLNYGGEIDNRSRFDERTNKTYYTSILKVYSKEMCEDLIKLGCVPSKKQEYNFPDIPKNLLHHFIRGYFDGDGCFSVENRKDNLTPQSSFTVVGGANIINEITRILHEETDVLLNRSFKRNMEFGTKGGNIQVHKIMSYIYSDATIYLDRKYEKVQNWLKQYTPPVS